jgi:hypothetical protein
MSDVRDATPYRRPAEPRGADGFVPPESGYDAPEYGFPGREPGESRVAYNDFFADEKVARYLNPFFAGNPERKDEIKALAWTYLSIGIGDDFIDETRNRGLLPAGSTDGSGSRGRGGGGGGGASLAQQYAAAEAAIRNQARTLGLELDEGGIQALAKTVVDANWSGDQLTDYLVPGAVSTTLPGTITATVAQIQQMAGQQLLNVSEATAREWAGRIASDEMTLEGVQSLLQTKATEKYGWAASNISQGVGVRDMLLPTRDIIARELELNPEDVDLMDSKWLSMVQTADSKTGEIRAATDSEVVIRARKDPKWKDTRAAAASMSQISTRMREYLGG